MSNIKKMNQTKLREQIRGERTVNCRFCNSKDKIKNMKKGRYYFESRYSHFCSKCYSILGRKWKLIKWMDKSKSVLGNNRIPSFSSSTDNIPTELKYIKF